MQRISSNLNNNDMQYYLRKREVELNQVQNGVASQNRIQNLRDDPIGAAHASRYSSNISRMERFAGNIEKAQSQYSISEGYIQQGEDIMQRVRELAVQGANGTFTQDDKAAMGVEVNQLLNELVALGNSRDADGMSLFAGTKSESLPFRAIEGHVDGLSGNVITGVDYTGSNISNETEIEEGTFVKTGFTGNEVFWAENQQVYSSVNSVDYHVKADTEIIIDNVSIPLRAGDNVETIISRINDSDAAVKASLDPVQNSLRIETTSPHQIWMEDAGNEGVLEDLGLVANNGGNPPHNFSNSARVYGGSLFDMVISLRDDLMAGNTEAIGGADLKGIDQGMNHLQTSLTELGALDERLESTASRLSREVPVLTERWSKLVDIDLTEAITELNMLQYIHQASLKTASDVVSPSLLDFMR